MAEKKLIRFLKTYFTRRGQVSQTEWKKIRRYMKESQNEIIQKIKLYDVNDWHVGNLRSILYSINQSILKFDAQFKTQQFDSMVFIGEWENEIRKKIEQLADLNIPPLLIDSDKIVRSTYAVTEGLIDFFSGDMRKIITSEISMGITQNKTPHEIAKSINDKYGLDTRQRDLLTLKQEKLKQDFDKGKISESEYLRKSIRINDKLRTGSNMSYARAERIATTEMLRTTSLIARERQLEISEIDPTVVKTWVNSHKPGAREGHLEAEAVYSSNPIPVNMPFRVRSKFTDSYEECQFPRDYSLSAKNTVWCACTSLTIKRGREQVFRKLLDDFMTTQRTMV